MSSDNIQDTWQYSTKEIHGGTQRTPFAETSEPIFVTSGFVYDNAQQAEKTFKGKLEHYQYSRISNPNLDALSRRLCLLEDAQACLLTATGMGAVFSTFASTLSRGDRIVASKALFGSSFYIIDTILPRFGIEVTWVNGHSLDDWKEALNRPAKLVHIETPSNPMLDILDISKIADYAHHAGALLAVDNVMATPIFQQPLKLGADIVIYSATKHIDGQGRVLGGAVLGSKKWIQDILKPFITNTGQALSPFNAWVLLKGLETLSLRVKEMARISLNIAEFLCEKAPIIHHVRYPSLKRDPQHQLIKQQMSGGGSVISFEVEGGKNGAFAFMNALQIIKISNNLGDVRTLITHPATTTHSKLSKEERLSLGITDGTIRLSVGLEATQDLRKDLATAIEAVKSQKS